MANENSTKRKLLTLMQLLYDKTDSFHGLSMAKIIEDPAPWAGMMQGRQARSVWR